MCPREGAVSKAWDLVLRCPMPPSKNEAYGVGADRRLKSTILREFEQTFATRTVEMTPSLWSWSPPEEGVLWRVKSVFYFKRVMNPRKPECPLVLDVHNREIWLYDQLSQLIGIPDEYFFKKSAEKRAREGDPIVEVKLRRYTG